MKALGEHQQERNIEDVLPDKMEKRKMLFSKRKKNTLYVHLSMLGKQLIVLKTLFHLKTTEEKLF